MKERTICLNFICRDNVDTIERMIMSAEPIIDEVVACDTGSVDTTVQILKRLKKRFEKLGKPFHIFHDEWKNFGHNRTLMSEHAHEASKADYIMVVDSDAWVETSKDFRKIFNADYYNADWYFANILINVPRFMKNDRAWKWSGYAHNVLDISKAISGGTVKNLIMKEDGRNREEEDKHIKRTYKLLKNQIMDGKGSARTNFYFARVSSGLFPSESVTYYYKVVDGENWSEEKYIAYCDLALIEPKQKLEHYTNAYEINPNRAEAFYHLGMHYRIEKKYHLAEMFLRNIMNKRIPDDALFISTDIYNYLRYFEFAIVLYWVGKYKEAFQYANIVKKLKNVPESILTQNEKNIEFIVKKL